MCHFRSDFTIEKRIAVFPTFKGKFEYCLNTVGILYTSITEYLQKFTHAHFTILVVIIMTHIAFPKGKVEGTLLVFGAGNSFRTCIFCPLNANHVLP